MSFEAAAWAISTDLVTSVYQRAVLIILADCHNADTNICNPSFKFIARRACISDSTVSKTIRELKDLGLLTYKTRVFDSETLTIIEDSGVHKGQQRISNQYCLAYPAARGTVHRHTGGGTPPDGGGVHRGTVTNQEERTRKRTSKGKPTFQEVISDVPDGVTGEAWERWFRYKSNGQSPATKTVNLAKSAIRDLVKNGYDPSQTIDHSIENEWQKIASPDWNLPGRLKSQTKERVL